MSIDENEIKRIAKMPPDCGHECQGSYKNTAIELAKTLVKEQPVELSGREICGGKVRKLTFGISPKGVCEKCGGEKLGTMGKLSQTCGNLFDKPLTKSVELPAGYDDWQELIDENAEYERLLQKYMDEVESLRKRESVNQELWKHLNDFLAKDADVDALALRLTEKMYKADAKYMSIKAKVKFIIEDLYWRAVNKTTEIEDQEATCTAQK